MEFENISELVQQHLVQGLFAVFVLPVMNWLIGRSKRDQQSRDEQELRHHMELSRGLHDLAAKEADPATRSELEAMRTRIHTEFLDKARSHLTEAKSARKRVEKRYWLLPWPHGFFGWIWSVLTVINLVFLVIMFVAAVIGISEEVAAKPDSIWENLAIFAFVMAFFALPTLLFRWFSFMSARAAAKSRQRRDETAAGQAQAVAA